MTKGTILSINSNTGLYFPKGDGFDKDMVLNYISNHFLDSINKEGYIPKNLKVALKSITYLSDPEGIEGYWKYDLLISGGTYTPMAQYACRMIEWFEHAYYDHDHPIGKKVLSEKRLEYPSHYSKRADLILTILIPWES